MSVVECGLLNLLYGAMRLCFRVQNKLVIQWLISETALILKNKNNLHSKIIIFVRNISTNISTSSKFTIFFKNVLLKLIIIKSKKFIFLEWWEFRVKRKIWSFATHMKQQGGKWNQVISTEGNFLEKSAYSANPRFISSLLHTPLPTISSSDTNFLVHMSFQFDYNK